MSKLFIISSLIAAGLLIAPLSVFAEEGKLWVDGGDNTSSPAINMPSFAPVVEELGKAVVNIRTEGMDKESLEKLKKKFEQYKVPGQMSPFDFFFQLPDPSERQQGGGVGSGFVINPEGYIVTNYHVVQDAGKILVSFRDEKKTYTATLVGGDSETDVALLKVEHNGKLSVAPLGDSEQVKPGDWVMAIGNPFRLGHTATVGIVSGKSRKVSGKRYENYIQTDAAINPGNSGGPLFNSRGEVIGVNAIIFSPGGGYPTGFNIGMGFAVPINLVKNVIVQLKAKGKVTRGLLGVKIQQVTPDIAENLKLKDAKGALVAEIVKGNPADKAGFEVGDVIVTYDGKEVLENDDLPLMVADTPIGKEVNVEIIRNGKKKTLKATITEQGPEQAEEAEVIKSGESRFGLSYQDLNEDIARSLGLDSKTGVVVTEVEPGTPAARAGLRRGDVVVEVDQQGVGSVKDFNQLTKDLAKNTPLLLLVRRGNNTIFLTVKIE